MRPSAISTPQIERTPFQITPIETTASPFPSNSPPQKKTPDCLESLGSFPYAPRQPSPNPEKILLAARRSPSPTGEPGAGFRARVPTLDPHPRRVTPRGRAGTKARGGLTHPRGEGGRVAKAPRSAGAPLPQARSAGPRLAPPRAAERAVRGAGEARPGRAGGDRGERPATQRVRQRGAKARACRH